MSIQKEINRWPSYSEEPKPLNAFAQSLSQQLPQKERQSLPSWRVMYASSDAELDSWAALREYPTGRAQELPGPSVQTPSWDPGTRVVTAKSGRYVALTPYEYIERGGGRGYAVRK